MSTDFPTSLDTLTNPVATDNTVTVSHAGQHADSNDAIESLETKVGIDSSADTTSIDYKLKNPASINPGHKHSFLAGISDVNITTPTDQQGLLYDITTGKWINHDTTVADASTTVKGVTKMSVAPASATEPIAVGTNDGRVPTQDENDALVGTSGTPSTSNKFVTNDDVTSAKTANKIARRDANGDVLVATTPTSDDAATSKSYVGSVLPLVTWKCGTTTKNAADADTTQTIAHGLGRTPRYIRITGVCAVGGSLTPTTTMSVYNGTTQSSQSFYPINTTPTYITDNTFTLNTANDTSTYTRGVITFDATNISIAWTKANSATGIYQLLWEAF